MKYLKVFGNSKFPRVALGCDHFGETIPIDTAREEMDLYLSMGGTVFDTACSYGQEKPETPSTSEVIIGKHLRCLNRANYTIITKGGHPPKDNLNHSRITEKCLKYDILQSVDQLGTVPDWWLFHRDNLDIPAPELIDMANSYMDSGFLKNIGASNWSNKRIEEANSWALKHGKVPFTISQLQYSLAVCTKESWGDNTIEVMDEKTNHPWYKKTGMPYMCFSSQGRGIIQKLIEHKDLGRAYRFDLPVNHKIAECVKKISQRDGVPISTVCLSFITSQKENSIAIVGATTAEQLKQTLSFCDYTLSKEDINSLFEIRYKRSN